MNLRSRSFLLFLCVVTLWKSILSFASEGPQNPLALDRVGDRRLTVLTPTVLELTYITTKQPDPAPVTEWNFVGGDFTPQLPALSIFVVEVNGQTVPIIGVGFKRRPIYAPLKKRDLRIGNYLYLQLATNLREGDHVTVKNPAGDLWPATDNAYAAVVDPLRLNPALHVNQVGYAPQDTKKAMVGFYLGSMGELTISATSFSVIDAASKAPVFTGTLTARKDVGYIYTPTPYQQVFEADFSALQTQGEYLLQVPGMGVSYAFLVHPGVTATFARTYALGLYHQRCGRENALPFTLHEHRVCHVAPASVPDMTFTEVNSQLASMTYDYANDARHTAPQLMDVNSSLYPFVNTGTVDVSRGHHDAGDYSKYTINSAGLIHHLVFAADALGAGDLDNLGLPESSNGKSDLLQEAKWEADFLSRMQDADGGFYFLVYPRTRAYEDNVLPDQGDPQVVFPKTTAATAAAVGALAEIASSPRFKQQYPAEAAAFLAKARSGWDFLMRAIATYGKDGSYQKITHYGNEFMHDDELAWAAAAMFAATGDPQYHSALMQFFPNPNDPNTQRWWWWRLFEGYGAAVRAYAFAVRSGRLNAAQVDAAYLAKCEAELLAAGNDIERFARQNAYGTSFPDPSKVFQTAGWYFSSERAFELATAHRLQASQAYLDAIVSNLGYEAGCNPVNVTFVTGLGWKRWRDVVHQYAQNDTRVLPPGGIPLGNITGGFIWLENYKNELGDLCFPSNGASVAPYPFYDRWGDSFNTRAEFVVVDQARAIATAAFMLARTGDNTSQSQGTVGTISGLPGTIPVGQPVTATLAAPGVDFTHARITWEASGQEPFTGPSFTFSPNAPGDQWVEAEVLLADGRRVFARGNFGASFGSSEPPNVFQSAPQTVTAEMAALYHLDGTLTDATGKNATLTLAGNAKLDALNLGWMQNRSGAGLRVLDLGDRATVTIAGNTLFQNGVTTEITLEAMIYVQAYKGYNKGHASLVSLEMSWNASLQFKEDMYSGTHISGGTQFDFTGAALTAAMPLHKWHHLSITINSSGYSTRVNGNRVASASSSELAGWNNGNAVLELGNFEGWIDEVIIRSRSGPISDPPVTTENPVVSTDYVNSALHVVFSGAFGTGQTIGYNDAFPAGQWTPLPVESSATGFSDSVPATLSNRIYRLTSSGGVVSQQFGFHKIHLRGSSDTLVSMPFIRPPAAFGAVGSASQNRIQLANSPNWVANRWVYASGPQTNTYFVLFQSGAKEGSHFTVTANDANSLTLDLDGASLAGIAAGDVFAIVPYWTLGSIFPGGRGIHASPNRLSQPTTVYFPDIAANGINPSAAATYYFQNGNWLKVGASGSRNDDVILPGMYLIVRQNVDTATELVSHGVVLDSALQLTLRRQAANRQDNVLALARPYAISLNESGLIESGAFQSSPNRLDIRDALYIFDNTRISKNKSAAATYYYSNGVWQKIGGGTTDLGAERVFGPGSGFIIRAAPASSDSIWTNRPN